MGMIASLLNWGIVRPWPVLIPVVLYVVVLAAGRKFPRQRRAILTASGTLMTAAGILITLLMLNQNMVTVQGRSLADYLEQWSTQFPMISRSAEVRLTGIEGRATAGNLGISTSRPTLTTEERLVELEKQVREIRGQVSDNRNALEQQTGHVDARVSALATSLQEAVIGDFRWPLFAALISMAGLFILSLESFRPSREAPLSTHGTLELKQRQPSDDA